MSTEVSGAVDFDAADREHAKKHARPEWYPDVGEILPPAEVTDVHDGETQFGRFVRATVIAPKQLRCRIGTGDDAEAMSAEPAARST